MNNKAKIYKIYSLIIKTTIIVLAFWFIYQRLFVKYNLDDTLLSFESLPTQPFFIKIVLMVALLMILNWSLETWKWRYLIRKIEEVNFIKAFVAVLSGVTVSIFTPNRIGEYAGRVFILEKADRWEGVLITMLGSISQLLITVLAGLISFIFFANEYIDMSGYPGYYFYGLAFIIIILVVVLLLLFFNVSFLTGFINRLPGKFRKARHYGKIFSLYSVKELLYILLLSFARYLVFTTQFFLLLILFGVKMPYNQAFLMISMIYMIVAAFPTFFLTEIGVRGSAAIYFIGMYFEKHDFPVASNINILVATSVLWIVNLAIPALLGAIFVFKLNFFRKS
ncbi:MAG: lysylphosphatidylglycerol synthase domain-containing protein [Bacteroidales bacterium]